MTRWTSVCALLCALGAPSAARGDLDGAQWAPLTLSFQGPHRHEYFDATPPAPANVWLDLRLTVEFHGPSGATHVVPGYFDADGQGGSAGDVWRVKLVPDEPGTWTYDVHFDQGPEIAVDPDLASGTSAGWFDGATGTLEIGPIPPDARGFHRWGLLEHVGEHHLKFRDGPYFLKTGIGSPENLLAYHGFDNTHDQDAVAWALHQGIHRFPSHVADFGEAGLGRSDDPWFRTVDRGRLNDSRGLIGALNYLASRHVNSVYMIPLNLGGDGWDCYPFARPLPATRYNKTHYDASKLAQWQIVLDHATDLGLALHLALAEKEVASYTWLDGGFLGVERKLFYRELIARFAHNLALKWNLSEETQYDWVELTDFAEYIRGLDPYDHPITFYSDGIQDPTGAWWKYDQVLSQIATAPFFEVATLQSGVGGPTPLQSSTFVEYWRERSASFGVHWVVDYDEQNQVPALADAARHVDLRKRHLYDVLFSGGNVEWYFGFPSLSQGGGDMNVEDFRTREALLDYSWYARDLMERHLPFQDMEPADELVTLETQHALYGGAEVFAQAGVAYAVYWPDATQTGVIDLAGAPGPFVSRWYDPRTGVFAGTKTMLAGGAPVAVGPAPSPPSEDWVLLLTTP